MYLSWCISQPNKAFLIFYKVNLTLFLCFLVRILWIDNGKIGNTKGWMHTTLYCHIAVKVCALSLDAVSCTVLYSPK